MTDTTPEAAAPWEQPCPGRCNARARRAWKAYEEAYDAYEKARDDWAKANPADRGDEPQPPEEPTIRAAYGEPWWCGTCMAAIRRCLAELDDLMALRLTQADGYQAPAPAERVRGFGEAPTPSPAQDDLDKVIKDLVALEGEYRDVRGWSSPPRRGVAAPVLTSQLAWLGTHLDGIIAHLDPGTPVERSHSLAVGFGQWVLREYAHLQNLTSTRPPLRHKPLPCASCGYLSLFWHEDTDTVHCHTATCRRVISTERYGEMEAEADQQVQHQAS